MVTPWWYVEVESPRYEIVAAAVVSGVAEQINQPPSAPAKVWGCELHIALAWVRGVVDGDELVARGLYLDVPAWSHHVFEMIRL